MERLHECFFHHFPVRIEHLGHVCLNETRFHMPWRKVVDYFTQVLGKGFATFVNRAGLNEYKPAPHIYLHLVQTKVVAFNMREVPFGGHKSQRAIEVPRKTMKRATQYLHAPRLRHQLATTVVAHIPKRTNGVFCRAHYYKRHIADVIYIGIAHHRNMLFTARHLPHLAPHVFFF